MKKKSLLIFFTCLFEFFISNRLKAQIDSTHYRIYDTKTGTKITIDELAEMSKGKDVIFFGEIHNDSIAHVIEYCMLRKLHKNIHRKIVLSLEAISDDYQLILDEYLQGWIDLSDFEHLANTWYPFFHSYLQLLEFAKSNKIPVIAAEVPTRYVKLVTSHGMHALDSLPEKSRKLLPPLPYFIDNGKYYEKYMHGVSGADENSFIAFSLYDATMAYNINRFLTKNKDVSVFHVTGRFHIEENLGTVMQLKRLAKVSYLTISCFYGDIKSINLGKYKNLADVVIITDENVKRTF